MNEINLDFLLDLLGSAESAPTSPRTDQDASKPNLIKKPDDLSGAKGDLPILSSSAPELEGIWQEVKRKVRTPKSKAEVSVMLFKANLSIL